MKRKQWMDATVPIKSGMISWPNNPIVSVSVFKSIKNGGSSNVSLLTLGSHTGTHVDAPRHFLDGAASVDDMPAELMMGKVRVIEIKDPVAIDVQELKAKKIRSGQKVFFRTRNSKASWWQNGFAEDFVFLTLAAAEYLVSRRVSMVGIDILSVGGYGQPEGKAVHKAMLSSGIWIVEGLDLTRARPGRYDILCFPLKIHEGDAAPARVLLRALKS